MKVLLDAILIARVESNRLADLLPLADACDRAIREIQPGELRRISG
jgi:hypothetical protein